MSCLTLQASSAFAVAAFAAVLDFIGSSIYDEYSGSMLLLHAWIMLVIVHHHLVQINRIDGPTAYLSLILAEIRLTPQVVERSGLRFSDLEFGV